MRFLSLLAIGCLLALSSWSAACDSDDAAVAEWNDPGYAKYFCVKEFGAAWGNLDASRLADVAFSLAEGERVLHRSHRHVSSAEVFKLAVEAAVETRDVAALKRINETDALKSDASLSSRIRQEIERLGTAAPDQPALMVSVDRMSVEQYRQYRSLLIAVRRAAIANDSAYLKKLQGIVVQDADRFGPGTKDALIAYVDQRVRNVSPNRGGTELANSANRLPAGIMQCDIQDKNGCFP